ncbi:MAG TPA: helix-turn-helix transcriptional regulator [Candidatus Limnocylindrales bacterium]
MPGVKKATPRVEGRKLALAVTQQAGADVLKARRRRRLTQAALARRVGISRPRLADIEAGRGLGAPLEVWFALAEALDRYLKFAFVRDPLTELVDAGHLAMQELVISVAKRRGGRFSSRLKVWRGTQSAASTFA